MFGDIDKDDFSPVKPSNVTFPMGRGGGLVNFHDEKVSEINPRCYGRGRGLANMSLGSMHTIDSAIGASAGPTASSTPITRPDAERAISPESLGSIISDLAQKIGESISASLNLVHQPSPVQPNRLLSEQPSQSIDASTLKVIVQKDTAPPPFFRGDKSDSFTIHEWEDMMSSYLNRMECKTQSEVRDLIMSRLAGRARDVVKVSLRSRPDLSASKLQSAVFDILKHNFSELAYSNMPMADFYNTVPRANESPMDYWIRLNKAIDVADECLHRRNKSIEDPAAEAVMMFISHCPDPTLALSFQFKPAEKWTAAEVQERLDNHQRDLKRVSSRANHKLSLSACSQCTVSTSYDCVSSPPRQPAPTPAQSLPPVSLNPNAVPFSPDTSFQHMVGMMDRVLSLCTASLTSPSQVHAGKAADFKNDLNPPCRVCKSKEHTTYLHCRRHRLCRLCFSPGHFKSDCPKSAYPVTPSDTAQLN